MNDRHAHTLPARYFVDLYASNPDPWRFTSSDYEREKYAATLHSLPQARYARALEVGCSIGVFTRELGERCADLVALDIAPSAIEAARARCVDRPQIDFVVGAVPEVWPEGHFDLIVLSEVLYFLDRDDLVRLVKRVERSLMPGGDCVLVHWTGETDYPLAGDEAVEGFVSGASSFCRPLAQWRHEQYRLDVLRSGHEAG
ncbi:methyltransferase type 12 [Methylobacterium sp. Leaf456]|uniref:class I SAM-dependent methyltransferase n=1 Tax=Methylobacterium sp. Leaf456 TaxID=1736382 RepID=UPI0006FA788C|nr:class I SAM-dependent methyltransferase [Methylobacterium sp. Leaf456]KQT49247.1 methyltransferase type 12 [Methylobacterium sp. Leaf456]